MNPTKPFVFFFLIACDLSNAVIVKLNIIFNRHKNITLLQNGYIRFIEQFDKVSQPFMARAYLREAKWLYKNGNFIKTIDKCILAIHTKEYISRDAFRLCARSYHILTSNTMEFTNRIYLKTEGRKERRLFSDTNDNNINL